MVDITESGVVINFAQEDKENEDSGAQTFAKYWYQYNWALLHILNNCISTNECAITMETHEDVMFINDTNFSNASLDLFQVKERSKTGRLTANKICSGSKDKPSVISKMISHINKKRISERINRIALVSSTGYNFDLANPEDSIDKKDYISFDHLSESVKDEIKKAVIRDLEISEIPSFIQFINGIKTTSLDESSMMIVGKIATYIDSLDPNLSSKPKLIYDAIATELVKIGCDTTRYNKWEDFLKHKTISNTQINKIIDRRSINPGVNDFESIWNTLFNYFNHEHEYNKLNFKGKVEFKNRLKKYFSLRISNKALIFDAFNQKVKSVFSECSDDSLFGTVNNIANNISSTDDFEGIFDSDDFTIVDAIFCEICECI
ncbi:hypothetical protein AB733_23880 [Photobacterium swingsii]|uniref:DUF4297 domain-containing protein n=1 Tax=Photobacterium swingsii TaxID=680026 RepID=A0A0J8V4Z5_9GAMM|nr:dsDNA nuclease domain-containing protein [Photobacterium swingsii]KMV28401.1 hypothetical protein AB733_23880 [Photobacterium swingsii]PSW19061.1 DUF4297 domain-containing protein [Photobacterium swingsii]